MRKITKLLGFFALIPALLLQTGCKNKEVNPFDDSNLTADATDPTSYVIRREVSCENDKSNVGAQIIIPKRQKGVIADGPVSFEIQLLAGYKIVGLYFNNNLIDKDTTSVQPNAGINVLSLITHKGDIEDLSESYHIDVTTEVEGHSTLESLNPGRVDFPDDNQEGLKVQTVNFKVLTYTGYRLSKIYFNGKEIDSGLRQITPKIGANILKVVYVKVEITDPDTAKTYTFKTETKIFGELGNQEVAGKVETSCSNITNKAGDKYTFKITTYDGYKVKEIKFNNQIVSENDTLTMLAGENLLVVIFEKIEQGETPTYVLEINNEVFGKENSSDVGGSISTTLVSDHTYSYTVIPNNGYKVKEIKFNGEKLPTKTFTLKKGNNTLIVIFEEIKYSVTTKVLFEDNTDASSIGQILVKENSSTGLVGKEFKREFNFLQTGYEVVKHTFNGEVVEATDQILPIEGKNEYIVYVKKSKVKATFTAKFINNQTGLENSNVGSVSYLTSNLFVDQNLDVTINLDKSKYEIVSITYNDSLKSNNYNLKLKLEKEENVLIIKYKEKPTSSIKDKYNCTPIPTILGLPLQDKGETAEEYYVYGFVTEISMGGTNWQILIKNNDILVPFKCYKILNYDNYRDTLNVGDEIVLKGKAKNYMGTIELYNVNIVEVQDHGENPVPPKPLDPDKDYLGYIADSTKFENRTSFKIEKIYDEKYLGHRTDYSKMKDTFYNSNYKPATTYYDAMSRSISALISGDINIPSHTANYNEISHPLTNEEVPYYNARLRYIYDTPTYDNAIGYIINDLDGDDSNDTVIFKDAAYISMDEVSAYLFAFHTVPTNWIADKSPNGRDNAIKTWGIYGRVNNGFFEGTRTYQPIMTNTNIFRYRECDFGHDGNFYFYDKDGRPNQHQLEYNNGMAINRGTCRFVYTGEHEPAVQGGSLEPLTLEGERHVFYTWTHYNDFEEYLNYKGGYGKLFGNLCVGNKYNDNAPYFPVRQATPYQLALFK